MKQLINYRLFIFCYFTSCGGLLTAQTQFGSQQIIDSTVYGVTKIVTADIDNDGFLDIITSQKYFNNNKISYFLNSGSSTFGSQIILTTNVNSSEGIAVADIDDNGWNDIVAISHNPTKVIWFPNSSNGFSSEVLIDSDLTLPEDVEIADIDNDGDLDIIVLDHFNIVVYYNLGGGNFNKVTTPNNQFEYYAFSIADLDDDGFKDIIIGSGPVLVYMNNNGSFTTHDTNRSNSISNNGFCFMTHTADLDGNGTKDLIIDGNSSSEIVWYSNDGNGFFTLEQTLDFTTQCKSVSAADFNNDGSLDVFASLFQEGEVALYHNNGMGNFGNKQLISTGNIAHTVVTSTADLNNDGKTDIIWAHPLSFHLNTSVLGLDDYSVTNPTSVFPNPAENQLYIDNIKHHNYTIIDMTGKVLLQGIYKESIDVSSLSKGLYLLKMGNETAVKFLKL